MKYLLSAVGSFGDVAPFVAVGVALRQRGHEVMMAVNPFFRPIVEEAGLRCRPVEVWRNAISFSNQPRLNRGIVALPLFLRHFLIPALGKRYKEVKMAIADWRPDFVFSHLLTPDTTWAAAQMGVPWAGGIPYPVGTLSAENLSYFPGLLNVTQSGSRLKRYGQWQLRIIARLLTDGPMNRVRKELGLSSQTGILLERIHDGQVTLGLWSRHYRPLTSDDPRKLCICGFPWFDRDILTDRAEEAVHFLDEGEAPIVFTLGTNVVQVSGNFFEVAARACAHMGRRGLLLTGREKTSILPNLPPGIKCFQRAPLSLIAPRARVVVHHGGIGTTAQVMRSGCPSVVVPFAHDQFDNALRIAQLGLGVTLSRRKMTVANLISALEEVLNDGPIRARCQAMKEKLDAEDGAVEAAQILERSAGVA
jgi:rhamnosyltransferase subunit B